MASRKIEDLHPDLQPLCRKFLKACEAAGLDILITCTYRSAEEQDELYARGRTKPGRRVTNAKGGQSKHNHTDSRGKPAALAFDIVPLEGGKAMWSKAFPHWQKAGEIGVALGLEWAGNWRRFTEYPHFQWKGAVA